MNTGGGGLIFVNGSSGNYKDFATVFKVDGGPGGACDICDQSKFASDNANSSVARGEHGLIHFGML